MFCFLSLLIFSTVFCSASNVSITSSNSPDLFLVGVADLKHLPSLFHNLDESVTQILSRGASQDASCPTGFLCVQQACPANILCPAGQSCINFEGTVACGVPGPSICALNPSTFQAVACNGGTCCHGNCYAKNTVCCDFPTIQCKVGELCNACNSGQTCGSNQCLSPGASSLISTTATVSISKVTVPPPVSTTSTTSIKTTTSTTSIKSITSSPPSKTTTTSIPTVSTTSTTSVKSITSSPPSKTTATSIPPVSTTSTTSVKSITSSPPSKTTTTSIPPVSTTPTTSVKSITSSPPSKTTTTSITSSPVTPTAVPSVDNFNNIGCFSDSSDARVLKTDQSLDGLTVEKCIASAKKGGFQYAGVEYGGQCWVGNILHGGSSVSNGDCNMACNGNPLELCGAAYRLQIYQDSTWFNPTTADLAKAIDQYTEVLVQAQAAISSYNGHMQALENILGKSSKARRQSTTITEIEMSILTDTTAMRTALTSIDQLEGYVGSLFLRGADMDLPQPIVNGQQLSDLQAALSETDSLISDVLSIAESDVPTITQSIAGSTTPLINVAGNINVAGGVLGSLGLPTIGTVVAVGIFAVFAALSAFFHGGDSTGGASGCTTITAQNCGIGCSVTNYGDISYATNCYTTSCTNTIGCSVTASTTTTATTTALCAISTEQPPAWTPRSGQLPLSLGTDNVWSTRTPQTKG